MSTSRTAPRSPAGTGAVPVSDAVESWVRQGLISTEQGELLRHSSIGWLRPTEPRYVSTSLAAEAAGYVAGVLVLVGSGLLASQVWGDLSTGVRVAVVGVAAATLLLAGWAVPGPRSQAATRLRSVLWLLASGTVGGFVALLSSEVLQLDDGWVSTSTAAAVLVTAGVLWLLWRSVVLELAVVVASLVVTLSLVGQLTEPAEAPAVAAWAVSSAWLLLAWAEVVPERRLVLPVSAAGLCLGALSVVHSAAGPWFAVVTVLGVVLLGVMLDQLLVLAVGALAMLEMVPMVVVEWFPGTRAAPIAVIALGVLGLLVSAWLVRHRERHERRAAPLRPSCAMAIGWAVVAAGFVVVEILVW